MRLTRHLPLLLCLAWCTASLGACSQPRLLVDVRNDFADVYATEPPDGQGAVGERAAELSDMLQEAALARFQRRLQADPRLALVADWMAERVAAGDRPQAPRRVAVTTRAGVPFPTPGTIDLRYTTGIASDKLRAAIARQLAELGDSHKYARFGTAVRSLDGEQVAVFVLTAADVALEAVPRHVRAGDDVRVRGDLAAGLRKRRLVVTEPGGRTQQHGQEGQAFDFALRTQETGVYAIELLGEGGLGPLVVANFPVYVDLAEPPIPVEMAREAVTDAASVEAELLRLINAERQKLGLHTLIPWPLLANVARAHSQDMAEHGFIAHISPSQGSPEERLRRSGIGFRSYGENVGMAATALEIHAGLMASPGHRAAIVNPAFTHVGIGAALQQLDKTYVPVVTEEFVAAP